MPPKAAVTLNGKDVSVPVDTNGTDLYQLFNVPDDKALYRKHAGKADEHIIEKDKTYTVADGDVFFTK